MKKIPAFLFLVAIVFTANFAYSQPVTSYSHDAIQRDLQRLKVLGSVLYVAAHPDDENQAVLAYMNKGRLLRSAYLSLTRGDGGQNLLGSEQGALLGVMRTGELLAARSVDGAGQFFSRAIDFGYSKSTDETLRFWGHEAILSDVVRVIRTFRADVIVTRFSEEQGRHGHHLASAVLAKEAFDAAGDPYRFNEHFADGLRPWKAKRLVWNSWQPDQATSQVTSLDLGAYDPLLGRSYMELAAFARTMHKSQGFGATPFHGSYENFFEHTAGTAAESDLLEGIDLSWQRAALAQMDDMADKAIAAFEKDGPQAAIEPLLEMYEALQEHKDNWWAQVKSIEIRDLLLRCSGLWLEALSSDKESVPGAQVELQFRVVNRSSADVELQGISLAGVAEWDSSFSAELKDNAPWEAKTSVAVAENAAYSQPFWLKNPADGARYDVPEGQIAIMPQAPPALQAVFTVRFDDVEIDYTQDVLCHRNDATRGAVYAPFAVVPEIDLAVADPVYLFASEMEKEIHVRVHSALKESAATIKLQTPQGWQVTPAKMELQFNGAIEHTVAFSLKPGPQAESGALLAVAESNGKRFDQSLTRIDYEHISEEVVLQAAEARLIKLDASIPSKKIGYIMGSGDEIPAVLQQIGMDVTLLQNGDINAENLAAYDAVICGVRAFNVNEGLADKQDELLRYVRDGGTWIVQHNTRFGRSVPQIGPYPFEATGRYRVSDETAAVEMLDPQHPLLNYPNKISQVDFEGWVQERGLYFATEWDTSYTALLASADPGEPPRQGGLLYAPVGKGVFIFTAYSWFRQLPAGVPGAIRLFTNLIAAGDAHE